VAAIIPQYERYYRRIVDGPGADPAEATRRAEPAVPAAAGEAR